LASVARSKSRVKAVAYFTLITDRRHWALGRDIPRYADALCGAGAHATPFAHGAHPHTTIPAGFSRSRLAGLLLKSVM